MTFSNRFSALTQIPIRTPRYLEEYDKMAQMYIQQMTERHAVHLLDFQRTLQTEMAERPPKWSRELLEWRRRQHMLARQKVRLGLATAPALSRPRSP